MLRVILGGTHGAFSLHIPKAGEEMMTRESEGRVLGQQAIGMSFSPDAPLSTRVPSR